MGQRIVDLDASGVTAQPITVVLRGVEYKLPGDIPAPLYVQITAAAASDDTDAETARVLYEELLATFKTYQPTLERLPLGLNEMVGAVSYVYGGAAEADAEDVEAPPTTTTTSPPAKRTTSKRSRS